MAGTRWLLLEILLNVALFIPAGFCLSMLMKERLWAVAMMAVMFSAAIKITQLVTKCGLFEFDDIFHNTLGAVTGSIIANAIERGIVCAVNDVKPDRTVYF